MKTVQAEKPGATVLDDEQLLAAARARDIGAARCFMTRYNQRLYRAAYAILLNRSDAEEIVQDTYVKVFTGPPHEPGEAALSTWITRIAINASIDRRRRIKRREALLEQEGVSMLRTHSSDTADTPVSDSSPEATLARHQITERLQQAMAQISASFRTVFILRDVEGLSLEETAKVLGIGVSTVKTRQFRARRQLRELLEPEWCDILQGAFPFAGTRCAGLADRVVSEVQMIWKGNQS